MLAHQLHQVGGLHGFGNQKRQIPHHGRVSGQGREANLLRLQLRHRVQVQLRHLRASGQIQAGGHRRMQLPRPPHLDPPALLPAAHQSGGPGRVQGGQLGRLGPQVNAQMVGQRLEDTLEVEEVYRPRGLVPPAGQSGRDAQQGDAHHEPLLGQVLRLATRRRKGAVARPLL